MKILNLTFLLSYSFLIFACGGEEDNKKTIQPLPQHDSFFDPYIKSLEVEWTEVSGKDVDLSKIPVIFSSEVRSTAIAHCATIESGKYIAVNTKYENDFRNNLNKPDVMNKFMFTLRHEFGHCYYLMPHDFNIVLFSDRLKTEKGSEGWFTNKDRVAEIREFIPKSIMYPTYGYSFQLVYNRNKSYYDRQISGGNINESILEEKKTEYKWETEGNYYSYLNPDKMTWYTIKDLQDNVIVTTNDNNQYLTAMMDPLWNRPIMLINQEDSFDHIDVCGNDE